MTLFEPGMVAGNHPLAVNIRLSGDQLPDISLARAGFPGAILLTDLRTTRILARAI